MVIFILGRTEIGKSALLHNILKTKLCNKDSKILIIVPEQSLFCNERYTLKMVRSSIMDMNESGI